MRVAYTLEQCWHDVPGGTAVATLEVGRRLFGNPEVQLVGVAGRHRRQPEVSFRPGFPVRSLPLARPWLYESWNRLSRPLVERATGSIDICHSTIAIPAATRARHVVTVHDVAFMHTPERFTKHGVRVMRAGLERCREADAIICPSQATRRDLIEFDFQSDRLKVIPWGVNIVEVGPDDRDRVRTAYQLPDRFVLFVGTLEPRKNLDRLAAAVAELDERMPLVVAGATGWGDRPRSVGDTRFLGFVSRADISALFDAATVFAYPSLQEGFGLPILEAMAQGTPVVTSKGTSTEEVAAGSAVLVNPHDVADIAAGLTAALADHHSLSIRGRKRAAELTWESTVEATIDVYRELIA
jgi:glycosyltransferase involved in cell wall biosynthesis